MLKSKINKIESGKRLKNILEEKGMKNVELIRAMNEDIDSYKSTISNLVNGKKEMSQYYAERIAKVLGINPLYLLGYIDTPTAKYLESHNMTVNKVKEHIQDKEYMLSHTLQVLFEQYGYQFTKTDYSLDDYGIIKDKSKNNMGSNFYRFCSIYDNKGRFILMKDIDNLIHILIESIKVYSIPEENILTPLDAALTALQQNYKVLSLIKENEPQQNNDQ